MKIEITVVVIDDNWTHLSRKVTVDQHPPFSRNDRAKPIARVRADALRDAKRALDRLLSQAIEIPDEPEPTPASPGAASTPGVPS